MCYSLDVPRSKPQSYLALLQDEGCKEDKAQLAGNQHHMLVKTLWYGKAVQLGISNFLRVGLVPDFVQDRDTDWIVQTDIS